MGGRAQSPWRMNMRMAVGTAASVHMKIHMRTEEPCELDACEVDSTEDVPDVLVARDESEAEFELDSWARWDQPSDFTEYYDLQEVGTPATNHWPCLASPA